MQCVKYLLQCTLVIHLKMTEMQDKVDETSVLLKEAKDENVALKDQAVQLSSSSSLGDSTHVEVRLLLA